MKKLENLRLLSTEELQAELIHMRKEQFNMRTKKAIGSLEKPHVFSILKKTIAQIKTLITEKAGNKND